MIERRVRTFALGLLLVTFASTLAFVGCSSKDEPVTTTDAGTSTGDASALVDSATASDSGLDGTGSGDATTDTAPPDPPSALRTCVSTCEKAAPKASVDTYYASLRDCSCKPDMGKCASVCPSYCPAGGPIGNACSDCVVRAYEVTCSSEIKCDGDLECVTFADCTRECAMKNR
jgi:hypothetical protein